MLHRGDALDVLPTLPEASFDAVLCDPPYGIKFMGKKWDDPGSFVERRPERDNVWDRVGGNHNPTSSADRARTQRSEGRKMQAWCEAWAAEVLRVLKPGAFLLAFGGTRTYHRLAVAVEDAGFEIRDSLLAGAWVYSQGFPKALDVSKAIDKEAGASAEREVIGRRVPPPDSDFWRMGFGVEGIERHGGTAVKSAVYEGGRKCGLGAPITAGATEEAARFDGWKSALKPAWEPVVVGMKPLDGTFARNAVEHGVAGLNVDGARIEAGGPSPVSPERYMEDRPAEHAGRYPSNLLLTHHPDCRRAGTRRVKGSAPASGPTLNGGGACSTRGDYSGERGTPPDYSKEEIVAWECSPECPVAALNAQAGERSSGLMSAGTVRAAKDHPGSVVYGTYGGNATNTDTPGDAGPASRFFFQAGFDPADAFGLYYCAKASTAERGGSRHPTIKPLELVTYLAKLLLPPPRRDGRPRRILVPFSGAGSEIIGAFRAGWEEAVGIEREPESVEDAERRIVGDAPLFHRVTVIEPTAEQGGQATIFDQAEAG